MALLYVSKDLYDNEKGELREGGLLLEATIEGNQIRELKKMSLLDPDEEDESESSPEQQTELGREIAREILGTRKPNKQENENEKSVFRRYAERIEVER